MQAAAIPLVQIQTMPGIIINRVSEIAGRRKMQVADLAKAAGTSYDTAKRFWYGDSKGIDFETLAKFCDALDCSVGDLFEFQKANGKNGDC